MANYYGNSRTNYVTISDLEGLKESLEGFNGIDMEEKDGRYAFFADTESGSFFAAYWDCSNTEEEDEDDEREGEQFDFEDFVMQFVTEGQVLVVMEAGSEKLRYISGVAFALVRIGSEIKESIINLNSIYEQAAKDFGIAQELITRAEY